MARTFVEMQNGRLKRMNNSLDGPGRDHWSNAGDVHKRRATRRRHTRELAMICLSDDHLATHDVTDEDFYGADDRRLTLRKDEETGMLAFASYGSSKGRRRRSNRVWN